MYRADAADECGRVENVFRVQWHMRACPGRWRVILHDNYGLHGAFAAAEPMPQCAPSPQEFIASTRLRQAPVRRAARSVAASDGPARDGFAHGCAVRAEGARVVYDGETHGFDGWVKTL